jgi:alkylated DNA repair dioxygenase AlkB
MGTHPPSDGTLFSANPAMATLFGSEKQLVPGFTLVSDFLTGEEEQRLVDFAMTLPLSTFKFQGFEAKRKTISFGFDYHFDSRKLTKGSEIPAEFGWIIEKVAAFIGIPPVDIEEVLVTEYPPNSVINWHRDAPPFAIIAGLSLLTGCRFRLRPYSKETRSRQKLVALPLARRSLYVMRDECREQWEHSIGPVTHTRYSVTFRTLKKE